MLEHNFICDECGHKQSVEGKSFYIKLGTMVRLTKGTAICRVDVCSGCMDIAKKALRKLKVLDRYFDSEGI